MDIDDLVRYPTAEDETFYARLNPALPAMWGPLMEKAWAKAFSNYESLGRGGWSSQSLKAFNGAPTEKFFTYRIASWDMFVAINSGKAYGYFYNFETSSGDSGDTTTNDCGITHTHAYSVLDTF